MAGELTRLQMTTEVLDIVGKAGAALAVSNATLKSRIEDRYINWAQRRIARFHSFHELNTIYESAATADGVKRYPLTTGTNNLGLTRPKDITAIVLLDSANSRRLRRWTPRRLAGRYPRPENYAEQRPRIYARQGNQVEMFPIPDDTYTLRIFYPQWPTPLTADGNTSDFENKDELIIIGTVLETYMALEEYRSAAVWLQRFRGMLDDARDAEGDEDWEPVADEFMSEPSVLSGQPWLEPGADPGDPLYGFPEA